MLNLSDPHGFRKTVAGLCMICAPLVLLSGIILQPNRESNEFVQLSVITDNPERWLFSNVAILGSLLLAIPAVLGLMHMLREREVGYGHAGGALALIGVFASSCAVAIQGFVGWQMASTGANTSEMVALWERINQTAGSLIALFLVPFCFAIGMAILCIGLYRARAVQPWTAAAIAVGAVGVVAAGPLASEVVSIVGGAFLLVGLFTVGRTVLNETNEEWEHTPEYRGFRPLAGAR
jgi:hypothetical protein